MKTTDTAPVIMWETADAEKIREKSGRVSITDALIMLPAGILGLIIGIFPLSLPVLYLIALLIVE